MSLIKYLEGQEKKKCRCAKEALFLCDSPKGANCCDALMCSDHAIVPREWYGKPAFNIQLCPDHVHHYEKDDKSVMDYFREEKEGIIKDLKLLD